MCGVCRSLDRLSAYARGPQIPASCGEPLLTAVRTWIGFVQDLNETHRGVVPCPRGGLPAAGAALPPPGETAAKPPEEPPIEGATAKAPAPLPPASKEEEVEDHQPPLEEVEKKERKEASSSHRSRDHHHSRRRSRTPKREQRKRARKSRSRRRSRHRSRSRLASPVRPSGVKEESSPDFDDREALRRKKARPRSPSHSPPRAPLPRRAAPSVRPEGRHWVGPIRAPRREPPPGQGKHFQKNKGESKRKRNRAFWRGAGRHRRR